jgi:ubiquinone/menaquinone biosynthesis C-methylase UbiE
LYNLLQGDLMTDAHFSNVYADQKRADAYAKLEFPGTYYLAYRDLPEIITEHVTGRKALDFGCGAGRSTRFVRQLGFDVDGVDISEHMIARAQERDPNGNYILVPDDDLSMLPSDTYDLVLCAFPFDNVSLEKKFALFNSLKRVLRRGGRIINLVSSPEIYVNEWTSFSTKDFPENRNAKSGDQVRVVMLDVDDRRPVEDIFCADEDYQHIYRSCGLEQVLSHRPLGKTSEPFAWVSETMISPWVIYVLKRA